MMEEGGLKRPSWFWADCRAGTVLVEAWRSCLEVSVKVPRGMEGMRAAIVLASYHGSVWDLVALAQNGLW